MIGDDEKKKKIMKSHKSYITHIIIDEKKINEKLWKKRERKKNNKKLHSVVKHKLCTVL